MLIEAIGQLVILNAESASNGVVIRAKQNSSDHKKSLIFCSEHTPLLYLKTVGNETELPGKVKIRKVGFSMSRRAATERHLRYGHMRESQSTRLWLFRTINIPTPVLDTLTFFPYCCRRNVKAEQTTKLSNAGKSELEKEREN